MTLGKGMVAVLALVIAGCSSDSTPSQSGTGGATGSTGSGATTSTGTTGGASGGNACKVTNCPNDVTISDDACNSILATPCADKGRAYWACSLANDSCEADGTQDGAKAFRACGTEISTFLSCFSSDAGTD